MFKKTSLAIFVTSACVVGYLQAETLAEIQVVADKLQNTATKLNASQIQRQQAHNLKTMFNHQLDVQVNDLQGNRSGNDGVNVRGLQGNRVAMAIDGVPLPESQENKLFVSFGQDFGAGNSIEPTALRSAVVEYSGSARSLSGRVDFSTLEPKDLMKTNGLGGFVATGYNSLDRSWYGTLAGSAKNEQYEGLALVTGRLGNETQNNGKMDSIGAERTKANPASYKNHYVLVKNAYQFTPEHKIKMAFEHQQKVTDTELLSSIGTSTSLDPRRKNPQQFGTTEDETRRARVSLAHEYQSDNGVVQSANTHLYLQNAITTNRRERIFTQGFRTEVASARDKSIGIQSDFTSFIDTKLPQLLRYGVNYQFNQLSNRIDCQGCNANPSAKLIFDPSAETQQHKTHVYLENEIALGDVTLTPHLGLLHYRLLPSPQRFNQVAADLIPVKAQRHTLLLPKLTAQWQLHSAFQPFVQYSKGVKTPSAQQLTSSFGNTVTAGGRVVRQYAVVGNGNLRPEVANNFSLGIKGNHDVVQYQVTGYYNKYKHFIDWETRSEGEYSPLIQYQNQDKAKIYGITANAKAKIYGDLFASAGIAYSKGKSQKNGEKSPINTIQPLKLKAGFGYESEKFGANVHLTHLKAKKEKDIKGQIDNPMRTTNIVDFGIYWKPANSLTLSANLNNAFNKKYWNWSDISYFAIQNASDAADRTANLTPDNADTYSAPGRNFNLGIRYEF